MSEAAKNVYVLVEGATFDRFFGCWINGFGSAYSGPYTEAEAIEIGEKLAVKGYEATLLKAFAKLTREKPEVKVKREVL